MKYVLVTLVGHCRIDAMELFFKHVNSLNTPPQIILVATTKELYKVCLQAYEGSVEMAPIHGEDDTGNAMIKSTTSAREALRKAIIELGYEWSAWLDNDILVPPDYVEKFCSLLDKDSELLYVNAFHPARHKKGAIRHGLGSAWIHLDVMKAHPFTMATLRGKTLGDDYIWKVVIGHIMQIHGFKNMSGVLFDVKHLTESGDIHEFTEKQRATLI